MMLESTRKLHEIYQSRKRMVSFGRWVINEYMDSPHDELYYEEDFDKQVLLIDAWLRKSYYYATIPPKNGIN